MNVDQPTTSNTTPPSADPQQTPTVAPPTPPMTPVTPTSHPQPSLSSNPAVAQPEPTPTYTPPSTNITKTVPEVPSPVAADPVPSVPDTTTPPPPTSPTTPQTTPPPMSPPKDQGRSDGKKKLPKKMIMGAVAMLLLVVGGAAAFMLSQNSQDLRQHASEGDASQVKCTGFELINETTGTSLISGFKVEPGTRLKYRPTGCTTSTDYGGIVVPNWKAGSQTEYTKADGSKTKVQCSIGDDGYCHFTVGVDHHNGNATIDNITAFKMWANLNADVPTVGQVWCTYENKWKDATGAEVTGPAGLTCSMSSAIADNIQVGTITVPTPVGGGEASCTGATLTANGQAVQPTNGEYVVKNGDKLVFTPTTWSPSSWGLGIRYSYRESALNNLGDVPVEGQIKDPSEQSVWCGRKNVSGLADDACDEVTANIDLATAGSPYLYFATNLRTKIGADLYWYNHQQKWVKAPNGNVANWVEEQPAGYTSGSMAACKIKVKIVDDAGTGGTTQCYTQEDGCTSASAQNCQVARPFDTRAGCMGGGTLLASCTQGQKFVSVLADADKDQFITQATGNIYRVPITVYRGTDTSVTSVTIHIQKYYCSSTSNAGGCGQNMVGEIKTITFSGTETSKLIYADREVPNMCGSLQTDVFVTEINGSSCTRPATGVVGNITYGVCNSGSQGGSQGCGMPDSWLNVCPGLTDVPQACGKPCAAGVNNYDACDPNDPDAKNFECWNGLCQLVACRGQSCTCTLPTGWEPKKCWIREDGCRNATVENCAHDPSWGSLEGCQGSQSAQCVRAFMTSADANADQTFNPTVGETGRIVCHGSNNGTFEIKVREPGSTTATTLYTGKNSFFDYTFTKYGQHEFMCIITL